MSHSSKKSRGRKRSINEDKNTNLIELEKVHTLFMLQSKRNSSDLDEQSLNNSSSDAICLSVSPQDKNVAVQKSPKKNGQNSKSKHNSPQTGAKPKKIALHKKLKTNNVGLDLLNGQERRYSDRILFKAISTDDTNIANSESIEIETKDIDKRKSTKPKKFKIQTQPNQKSLVPPQKQLYTDENMFDGRRSDRILFKAISEGDLDSEVQPKQESHHKKIINSTVAVHEKTDQAFQAKAKKLKGSKGSSATKKNKIQMEKKNVVNQSPKSAKTVSHLMQTDLMLEERRSDRILFKVISGCSGDLGISHDNPANNNHSYAKRKVSLPKGKRKSGTKSPPSSMKKLKNIPKIKQPKSGFKDTKVARVDYAALF